MNKRCILNECLRLVTDCKWQLVDDQIFHLAPKCFDIWETSNSEIPPSHKPVCLVNWLHTWAFCKIQDGVQDGRQLQGFTMMDVFQQPLDRFWWSLALFISFLMSWIQWKYIWNHKKHISWWYFNYEELLCHSSMQIFMNMKKITSMNWNKPVWIVRVSAW